MYTVLQMIINSGILLGFQMSTDSEQVSNNKQQLRNWKLFQCELFYIIKNVSASFLCKYFVFQRKFQQVKSLFFTSDLKIQKNLIRN